MSGFRELRVDRSNVPVARIENGIPPKAKHLTQERVRKLFHYDPHTGVLIRLSSKKFGIERVVTSIDSEGYLRASVDCCRIRVHRLIWLYVYGYLPENDVDHINRIRTDNRLCNLREVSRSCNIRNSGLRENNKSGVKGVHYIKSIKKWSAFIYVDKKNKNLGVFTDFIEAVATRLAAEQCLSWYSCQAESTAYTKIQEFLNAKQQ